MKSEKIISINKLSFSYPTQDKEKPALYDISMDVLDGECLAILGPTGAGKSTLCMTLNGIIPQVIPGKFDGSVNVAGHDNQQVGVSVLAQIIGLMFQDPESQLVGMTVEEEMFFGAGNYGVPRQTIKERSKWALDLLRLAGYEDREPGTLSGGEKQRVSLAAVLVMNPKVLVLDEPTSELDPLGRSEVRDILKSLKKELGITIIITSHDTEEVAELADRVVIMHEGEIVKKGKPTDVLKDSKELIQWGLHPPQVVEFWRGLEQKKIQYDTSIPITLESARIKFPPLIGKQLTISKTTDAALHNKEDAIREPDIPVIEIDNLHYSYPNGTVAINGIDLVIHSGEYIAIIGQNGSGKSTLVKHFNGLLKPSKGSVLVNKRNTKETRTSELSQTVGYCFQNPDHQIFRPTVRDEISFGPTNLGFSKERLETAVERAAKMVGLEQSLETYPFNLGKGQRQKVALASIIAMESNILIVDEPTTGLDWKTGDDVMKILKELNNFGRTIIVITHDMKLVAEHVQRTIVLNQGLVLLDGPTKEVLPQIDVLRQTYLEPPQITQFFISQRKFGLPGNILTVSEGLKIIKKV